MLYKVQFKPSAEKHFAKLAKVEQVKIFNAIELLAENPRPHGVKKLKSHSDLYRIRVGAYRVIYSIGNKLLLITVVKIGHRRDIYKF